MSQYNTKEFLKLQKKWYQKAKESGFVDIEKQEQLIVFHSTKLAYESAYGGVSPFKRKGLKRHTMQYQDSMREYYRIAIQFLNTHSFSCEVNRRIWELHCDGKSQVVISKLVPERTLRQCRLVLEHARDVMLGRVKGAKLRRIRKTV